MGTIQRRSNVQCLKEVEKFKVIFLILSSRFNIEHALYYRYLICRERENRVFTCKDSLSFDPRKEYNIEIEDPFVKGKWIFSRFNFSFMSYIYLCILSMVIHSIVHFLKHKRMILQNLGLLRLQLYI